MKPQLNNRKSIDITKRYLSPQIPDCDQLRFIVYDISAHLNGSHEFFDIAEFSKVNGKFNKAIRFLKDLRDETIDLKVIVEY